MAWRNGEAQMTEKAISPFAWLGHTGAGLSFLGWILIVFANIPTGLVHLTLLVPLLYLLLWLFGHREQVWYDEHELMGMLAASTYFSAAFSAILSGVMLFASRGSSAEIVMYFQGHLGLYRGALILMLLGGILLAARFYLNSSKAVLTASDDDSV